MEGNVYVDTKFQGGCISPWAVGNHRRLPTGKDSFRKVAVSREKHVGKMQGRGWECTERPPSAGRDPGLRVPRTCHGPGRRAR